MKCADVQAAMLEAELDELRGAGSTPIAKHVASCADCASYAQRILRSYGALASGLEQMSTQPAAAPVIPMRSRKRNAQKWLPLPLAAAAILALLLVRTERDELPNVDALARMTFRDTPLVTPPAGKQALVMERNEMTIVWLYEQEKP
jgi:hypothetical protein